MTAESHCSPTGISLEDTGYGYTLSVINGKYKMIILYWLALYKPVLRFNELQRCIGTISYKTLSSTLKELEKDRLVVRKEYPQIPPKVEYSLSERGRSLIPVIDMMCNWGNSTGRNSRCREGLVVRCRRGCRRGLIVLDQRVRRPALAQRAHAEGHQHAEHSGECAKRQHAH